MKTPTPAGDPSMKYKSSSLSEEEIASIFKALKQLFEREEIYLDPQLKIHDFQAVQHYFISSMFLSNSTL